MKKIENMSELEIQEFAVQLAPKLEELVEAMGVQQFPFALVMINPAPGPYDKTGWCVGNCNPVIVIEKMEDVIEMLKAGQELKVERSNKRKS